jgi:hypothetical protein
MPTLFLYFSGAVAVDSSGFVYTYVFYLSFVYSLVTETITFQECLYLYHMEFIRMQDILFLQFHCFHLPFLTFPFLFCRWGFGGYGRYNANIYLSHCDMV